MMVNNFPFAPQPEPRPRPRTRTRKKNSGKSPASSLLDCQNPRKPQPSAKGGPTNGIQASASQNSKVQNTPATSGETDVTKKSDSVDVKRANGRERNRKAQQRRRDKESNVFAMFGSEYSVVKDRNSLLLVEDEKTSVGLHIMAEGTRHLENEVLQLKERITNIRLRMDMITPKEGLRTKFDRLVVCANPSHFSQAPKEEYSVPSITSTKSQKVDVPSGFLSGKKLVRTESMQRVASQEHLRKRSLLGSSLHASSQCDLADNNVDAQQDFD